MARIAVIGAGGIGAVFGAQWLAAGHEVLFCSRRPFSILRIESTTTPVAALVDCIVDPNLVPPGWRPAEWVFVAVKVHQTARIRPWLDRLVGAGTHVVALQNGLESVAALAAQCAGEILDAVVYCGVECSAPGRVRHRGGLELVVPDGSAARALEQLCAATPVTVTRASDFVTPTWRKVLLNSAANGTTALTRRPLGVLARADAGSVAADLLAEGLRIATACGAVLDDGDTARILDDLRRPEAATVAPSMLQDRLAGRPTEHDALYGAVVRAAQEHDLPATLHHSMQRLLAAGDP